MNKIRVGIAGYGNLGRGVELSIRQNPDMELAAVFTRRDPCQLHLLTQQVAVYAMEQASERTDSIDVMILCGGSATDLPVQTPQLAALYNVVDSFDTHANIPTHFEKVNQAALASEKIAVISAGWDPGMFSLLRLYGEAALPEGNTYTFWGRGVSQGHSDAIRRVKGVKDARQYTIPVEKALEAVRNGQNPQLSTREKHVRECFVVAEEGADHDAITEEIVNMPNYFADYHTTVQFISQEELDRDHKGIPHGGFVLRSGVTGVKGETGQLIEYSLRLGSNPEFTASILVACARAAYRLHERGEKGARTLFDIPPALLSSKSEQELRQLLL